MSEPSDNRTLISSSASLSREPDYMCELKDFDGLHLTEQYRARIERELPLWHRCYLPVGKTVLDVGAGMGETALFYLNHGASRVICIEADPESLKHLRENFRNDPRIQVIDAHIDSVKVDIEGGERGMVVETHFPPRFSKLWNPWPGLALWKIEERSLSVTERVYGQYRSIRRLAAKHGFNPRVRGDTA